MEIEWLPHAQDIRLIHDVDHDAILGGRVRNDVCQQLLVTAKSHDLTQHSNVKLGHNMLQVLYDLICAPVP